uniref:EGF-like domain-containing protein n=1 Tax=Amphiprion ocellaris TaxID=80972 RepID=A0AAQ5Y9Z3_AMPOC
MEDATQSPTALTHLDLSPVSAHSAWRAMALTVTMLCASTPTGPTDCPNFSNCINMVGSSVCECWEGYQGNSTTCEDINECLHNSTCGDHSTCVNTNGSYLCLCDPGFSSFSDVCVDIDECSDNELGELCTNGTCMNAVGSYYCECNKGFRSNVTECVDVDEYGQCHSAATCINYVGSFKCSCNHGWDATNENKHGKGGCVDVDECVSLMPCPGQLKNSGNIIHTAQFMSDKISLESHLLGQ